MFLFRGYLFLLWHLTHRGGGRIFVFWTSDAEKITIFWESSLWEKIAFFRPGQSCCSEQFQKKLFFGGIFWNTFFIIFFLRGHVFLLCFWVVHDFRRAVRKNEFFSCPKNYVFSGEKERCFLAPAQGCGAGGFVPGLYVKTFDKNPKTIFM